MYMLSTKSIKGGHYAHLAMAPIMDLHRPETVRLSPWVMTRGKRAC